MTKKTGRTGLALLLAGITGASCLLPAPEASNKQEQIKLLEALYTPQEENNKNHQEIDGFAIDPLSYTSL